MQETHEIDIDLLKEIWKGEISVNNGPSNARGVDILLKGQGVSIINEYRDTDGRYVITEISQTGRPALIVNVYCPNLHSENLRFLKNLKITLENVIEAKTELQEALFIAGDFNCGLNDAVKPSTSLKLVEYIQDTMNDLGLIETSQISKTTSKITWCQGKKSSQIDNIFTNSMAYCNSDTFEIIWNEFKTDHAVVRISFHKNKVSYKGKSYMKFSKIDIKDAARISKLDTHIKSSVDRYSSLGLNPHDLWESIKQEIKLEVKKLRAANRAKRSNLEVLKVQVENLANTRNSDLKDLDCLRKEIFKIEELEEEIASLQAGVTWREQGERSAKLFKAMVATDRAHCELTTLNTEQGELHELEDIKKYIRDYYCELYRYRPTQQATEDLLSNVPRLSNEQRDNVSKPLTISELRSALKGCKDSAPGMDGIPYSFFVVFERQLLPLLPKSWNYSLETGRLPVSQRTSCINLIPKKDKDLTHIKNWRPISLTATDIKPKHILLD